MKYYIQKPVIKAFLFFIGVFFSTAGYPATYYVSNAGSDSNNGHSQNNPWKTLDKVNSASLSAGDAVLFKSGDEWYGKLVPQSGSSSARITYGAYGSGNKPLIHGSITKMNTGDWVDQGSNRWRSSSTYSTEIGNIFLNSSMCGVRKYSDGALSRQGDFYYNTSSDYLTIYSKGNPASFYSDLKLLSAFILVSMNDKANINVKDLNLSYTSGYSVVGNGVSGITLSNLTMIWIGGQTHSGEVRKGNAVEFWNNCRNALVEKCTVGEVFDAGLSNQGDNATQSNITYRKNVIYHCEYSYEYFLDGGETSNILFENNTCVDAGLGWGHTQRTGPSGRHLRIAGTPPNTSNFVVRNNIFCNAVDVLNYTRDIEGLESRFTFNYNAYYQTLGSNLTQIKMVYYPTFSAYRSATGWESNSINKDPLFIDASNHDYHLASNSPCIDAGDPSSSKDDNGSRSDMGALESGSSSPNTADTSSPIVTSFTISPTASTLTVLLSTFNATDNVGVTGYLVNETAAKPTLSNSRWSSTPPATYQALSEGTKTLYAWVKDDAGNISLSVSQTLEFAIGGGSNSSNIYYLSPSGDDIQGSGTLDNPWFSLNKAWTVVHAGNTVYMRGGTYHYDTSQILRDKSGTPGSMIRVWAMPGELPVISPGAGYRNTRGIDIAGNYIHIKGLEITGFAQQSSTAFYYGIVAENANFNIYELLKVHGNGFGLSLGSDSGDNLVLNSDFYNNSDPLSSFDSNVPWAGANGITIKSNNITKTNTISGCRIWWNSDDGVDLFENQGTVVIENCWSFWNGYIPGTFNPAGNGDGFKLGVTLTDMSSLVKRIVRNNLAFENHTRGFDQNNALCITQLYNNTSYNNANLGNKGRSFDFWNGTAASEAKNNLDFKYSLSALFNSQAELSSNTFQMDGSVNSQFNVTSDDFISLDHTGVDGPRQDNGKLPELNFLKLAQGSDLVNKGTNVGLPFYGSSPDIGAFESLYLDNSRPIVTAFMIPSTSSSLRVPISISTATDNSKVTGYLLTETSEPPSSGAAGWKGKFPSNYVFSSEGTKTLYAWVKDATGNVSSPLTGVVTILLVKSAEIPIPSEENMVSNSGDNSTVKAKYLSSASQESMKIDVFPNPCIDNVTVSFSVIPEPGSRIEIIDIKGRRVASREITTGSERFYFGEQTPGLYIVKTIIGSNEVSNKLIINR